VQVIQRSAAHRHRIHLNPAWAFLIPHPSYRYALPQHRPWPRAAAPGARRSHRCKQPIQRSRARA
jgi:hypothetical protein